MWANPPSIGVSPGNINFGDTVYTVVYDPYYHVVKIVPNYEDSNNQEDEMLKRKTATKTATKIDEKPPLGSAKNPYVVHWDYTNCKFAKKFYGPKPSAAALAEIKVGDKWLRPVWGDPPAGFRIKTIYAGGAIEKDGEYYQFLDGAYFVLEKAPLPKLTVQSFPTCCGLRVITNFGNTNTGGSNPGMTAEAADASLKEIVAFNKNSIAGLLIAINNQQVAIYDKVIKKHGFSVVSDAVYHPGHGNRITTYFLAMNKR